MFNPAHPGEVLREYLDGVSITDAARKLGVTRVTLSRILNKKAAVSAEMALRLGQALNTSPKMWLGMQADYDLWVAEQKGHFNVKEIFGKTATL